MQPRLLTTIISGGQTGADQAGLRAAKAVGIATGGWVPLGWKTDDGPAPWLADYGCQQHPSNQYAPRTVANVRMAQALIWFGHDRSPGGKLTLSVARDAKLEILCVTYPQTPDPPYEQFGDLVVAAFLTQWLAHGAGPTLMIAGNRESTNLGIGAFVELVMTAALESVRATAPA